MILSIEEWKIRKLQKEIEACRKAIEEAKEALEEAGFGCEPEDGQGKE